MDMQSGSLFLSFVPELMHHFAPTALAGEGTIVASLAGG